MEVCMNRYKYDGMENVPDPHLGLQVVEPTTEMLHTRRDDSAHALAALALSDYDYEIVDERPQRKGPAKPTEPPGVLLPGPDFYPPELVLRLGPAELLLLLKSGRIGHA
jgi:hypothetical protein